MISGKAGKAGHRIAGRVPAGRRAVCLGMAGQARLGNASRAWRIQYRQGTAGMARTDISAHVRDRLDAVRSGTAGRDWLAPQDYRRVS